MPDRKAGMIPSGASPMGPARGPADDRLRDDPAGQSVRAGWSDVGDEPDVPSSAPTGAFDPRFCRTSLRWINLTAAKSQHSCEWLLSSSDAPSQTCPSSTGWRTTRSRMMMTYSSRSNAPLARDSTSSTEPAKFWERNRAAWRPFSYQAGSRSLSKGRKSPRKSVVSGTGLLG